MCIKQIHLLYQLLSSFVFPEPLLSEMSGNLLNPFLSIKNIMLVQKAGIFLCFDAKQKCRKLVSFTFVGHTNFPTQRVVGNNQLSFCRLKLECACASIFLFFITLNRVPADFISA